MPLAEFPLAAVLGVATLPYEAGLTTSGDSFKLSQ